MALRIHEAAINEISLNNSRVSTEPSRNQLGGIGIGTGRRQVERRELHPRIDCDSLSVSLVKFRLKKHKYSSANTPFLYTLLFNEIRSTLGGRVVYIPTSNRVTGKSSDGSGIPFVFRSNEIFNASVTKRFDL